MRILQDPAENIDIMTTVLEQAPTAIVITNHEGNILYVNAQFEQLTLYARDEVLGKNARLLKSGRTPAPLYHDLWSTIRGGRTWHGSWENRKKNGETYHEVAKVAPIKNAAGQVIMFLKVAEDITAWVTAERSLLEERNKFEAIFSGMGEGVCIIDREFLIRSINPAMERIVGTGKAGAHCYTVFHGREQRCRPCPVENVFKKGETIYQRSIFSIDGGQKSYGITTSPLRSGPSSVTAVIKVIRDITSTQNAEEIVRNIASGISEEIGLAYFQSLAIYLGESLGMEVVIIGKLHEDAHCITTLAFSYQGHSRSNFTFTHSKTPFFETIQEGTALYPDSIRLHFTDNNMLEKWHCESFAGVALKNSQGKLLGVLGGYRSQAMSHPDLVLDILQIYATRAAFELERQINEKDLLDLAYKDSLTGLMNRRMFDDRLEMGISQARRTKQKLGLLFIDLDNFKEINDLVGHDGGDRALIEVAKRLRHCCRRDTDIISRRGGDEFMIMISDVKSSADIEKIAQAIHREIGRPFLLKRRRFKITVSIGLSIYPTNGRSVKSLTSKADLALYGAKETGKNRVLPYSRVKKVKCVM